MKFKTKLRLLRKFKITNRVKKTNTMACSDTIVIVVISNERR